MIPATHRYIPHIDGLRAIAILAVLIFHLSPEALQGGFIGVDIFFVISGYLITRIIIRDLEAGTFSLKKFYERRIKRIFPALFVMLIASVIATILMFDPEQYTYHLQSLRMASVQASNFFFMKELDYFASEDTKAALLHTWSLGVEEQFYLIWPIFLLLSFKFLKSGHKYFPLIFLALISLGLSEYVLSYDQKQAFYMLHTRAWELAIGGIVAFEIIPTIKKKIALEIIAFIGIALILGSTLFLSKAHFPGLNALYPCLGAAFIIYSGLHQQTITHKALSVKPILFFGLISYSLYLWHWPIIIFAQALFGNELDTATLAIIALISIMLATLSYHCIEKPFQNLKSAPLRTFFFGIAIISLLIVASNVLKKKSAAPWRITAPISEKITRPNQWFKICAVEGSAYDAQCTIGPNKDKYEAILVGDSHASHFIPTVVNWANSEGITVRLFMRGACNVWVNDHGAQRIKDGKIDHYCMQLTKDFYTLLENNKHIQYVFLAQRSTNADDEEKQSLEQIQKYVKNVIFLGSVPEFKENPNHCYIRKNLLISKIVKLDQDERQCRSYDTQFIDDFLNTKRAEFILMLNSLGIPYFNPYTYMPTPYDKDGNFLFLDTNHLNIYGAEHLTPHFKAFMHEYQQDK